MKKRNFLLCIFLSFLSFTIWGCQNQSASNNSGLPKTYTDAQVASDFKKGLQNRWKYVNDHENDQYTLDQYVKEMKKYIDFEKDSLSKYSVDSAKFENTDTKKLISDYLDILNKQYKEINDFPKAYTKTGYNYSIYNAQRGKLIKEIVEKFNIKFDNNSYQDNYEEVISSNDDSLEAKKLITDTLNIENVTSETEWEWTTLKMKVTNQTNLDFDMVTITVREYDEDGTVISDQACTLKHMKGYQSMYASSTLDKSTTKVEIISYDIYEATSQAYSYDTVDYQVPFSKTITKEI